MQEKDTYQVKLEIFEGPMDLLLYLIRKNEVDVYDIPIALIVEQYMAYLDLLRELSHNTQFIIVTHNRNTVQVADVIYGVTMGRDSVSQIISLKMDEVSQVVK